MLRCRMLCVIAVLGLFAGSALAQTESTTDPNKTGPVTSRPDRTTGDYADKARMAQERSELKQKRAGCVAQAKEQKIGLLKRGRFIHQCMSGS
jgi:hypothetical protein